MLWLRTQPGREDLVRDAYLDDPIEAAARRFESDPEWRAILSILPAPAGTMIDIGAGRGITSVAFARAGWNVTALEPDPSSIVGVGAIRELSSRMSLPISILEGVGEAIPSSDCEFDFVHARQVLHHARDLSQLCGEMYRVCRPGGLMLATREHVLGNADQLSAFLSGHPLHRLYGGEMAYLLDVYLAAIRSAGFRVMRVLGPLSSPINYSPELEPALRRRLIARISRGLYPRRLPAPPLSFLAWILSGRTYPGMLFTFLAQRPQ